MQKKSFIPSIGIDAADLCQKRIDGTRIYILNMLQRFGSLAPETIFHVYLQGKVNPYLEFKNFSNYKIRNEPFPFFWTQLKLPSLLRATNPQVLWMPLHNLPIFRPRGLKTVITIHDLAFKLFPDFFPAKDLLLLNYLTAYAVKNADRIIAISRSTARDLNEMYEVPPHKIKVIHHGYDGKIFRLPKNNELPKIKVIKERYKIPPHAKYLIYVGAIQPRKNLGVLVSAFERIKTLHTFKDWKLVLAGSDAWMMENLKKQIKNSVWRKDIIMTGNFSIPDLPYLLWGAEIFVFPSLYEGFGIPILEAMACGVPVITAKNSSLIEAAGNNALFFDTGKVSDLAATIKELYSSSQKMKFLKNKGLSWVKNFSWEKAARKTYECLIETAIS
ncbi:MAG: glycosyltransferase family 4 protein [Candidatus Moranbacteria bacterium]|nr:glycosyltransferase family 4 protein [Candidatus Moranbacteria bacterium]